MNTVADIILIASRFMALLMPVGMVIILTDNEFTMKKLVDYILGRDDSEYSKLMIGEE